MTNSEQPVLHEADQLIEDLRRYGVVLVEDEGQLMAECPMDVEVPQALMVRLGELQAEVLDRLGQDCASMHLGIVPASSSQQRLWFIDRLDGGGAQYNLPLALRLRGRIDHQAVERALHCLVTRHRTLRTSYALIDREVVQRLQPPECFKLSRVDLRGLSASEQQRRIDELAAEDALRRFDLTHDLMLRAMLVQVGEISTEADCVLVMTVHHIAADGWSVAILTRDFVELYDAFRQGREPSLPPLSRHYADYARWQREQLRGERLEAQAAYWKRQLEGLPVVHALPLDFKRPALQSFNGRVHRVTVGGELLAALKHLALAQRSTLFMVMQAAFAALLHRRSSQDDIVMGVPVAGRTHAELEPMVGLFVNTLVLRNRVHGEMRFAELLAQSRETALAAFEHQDLPFEMLVERLNPVRSRSHAPLFQVLFSMQAQHVERIALPDVEIELLRRPFRQVKWDLELEVAESRLALTLDWAYATSLFAPETVERMASQYLQLLQHLAHEAHGPDTPVWQLPVLLPSEARALAQWNDTEVPFPPHDTLVGLFEQQADRDPARIALVAGDRQWTYGELDARANRLAHALVAKHGVDTGVPVGLFMERGLDMVLAMLAIMKAGGAYVALDAGLPAERLATVLADCRPAVVLTQAPLALRVDASGGVPVQVVSADEALPYPDARQPARAHADSLAYVIYTSGSTGVPKGTLNLHRGPSNRIHAMQRQFQLTPHDRVLHKTPLTFDVSVWELFWPLSQGASVVLAEPQGHKDPLYLARTIAQQKVTVVHFVPSMLQVFLRAADTTGLGCVRYMMTSGEALTWELQGACIAAFPQARLINHYGPTETGIEVTHWCFDLQREDRIVPIGQPLANVRLHVLDGHGLQAPIGVPGELHIAGVQVGEGYLNNAPLTQERFITAEVAGRMERMYRTGDLARWLPDGQVEYIGRLDGQIKLRGMRVELGEIEGAVRAQPGVAEAVVIVEGELAAQQLVCHVMPRCAVPDEGRFLQELRAALARTLPSHLLECRFVLTPELPLSTNGKIDRQALARMAPRVEPARECVLPAGQMEHLLRSIWATHLKVGAELISTTDNFFEVGGNSLLTIAVQADIRQATGIEVPIADLFHHPTIQHLARHLAGGAAPLRSDRSAGVQSARERTLKARARARTA